MEKRYQVFVSSTYTDLKEERKYVTQALMEMDCIPAGMELFPAADEEQWEFIKKVIDDCDYYLLIIGGRYGSITDVGISYTEKEYDYAVEKGIKVIALLHENPSTIPLGKSDVSPELIDKLQTFRDKVKTNRLIKFWNEAKELPGLVALSLSKTIKMYPATGWVRAASISSEELLGELNELRKENGALKNELANIQRPTSYNIEGLADFNESFVIHGSYYANDMKKEWTCSITWREIFFIISPYLVRSPNSYEVKAILHKDIIDRYHLSIIGNDINDQDFQTIKIQLQALGLIKVDYLKKTNGMAIHWSLSPDGEKLMVQLRAIKTATNKT